jgi:hypothetical protein
MYLNLKAAAQAVKGGGGDAEEDDEEEDDNDNVSAAVSKAVASAMDDAFSIYATNKCNAIEPNFLSLYVVIRILVYYIMVPYRLRRFVSFRSLKVSLCRVGSCSCCTLLARTIVKEDVVVSIADILRDRCSFRRGPEWSKSTHSLGSWYSTYCTWEFNVWKKAVRQQYFLCCLCKKAKGLLYQQYGSWTYMMHACMHACTHHDDTG